jgi:uncharacterized protein (DUF3820 family)
MRIVFGMYAGQDHTQVPPSYLHWLVTHVPLSEKMKEEIKATLRLIGRWSEGDDYNVMPVGKYAGCQLEEIPLTYLSWALCNMRIPGAVYTRIEEILEEAEFPAGGHISDSSYLKKTEATPASLDEPASPSRWGVVAFAGPEGY